MKPAPLALQTCLKPARAPGHGAAGEGGDVRVTGEPQWVMILTILDADGMAWRTAARLTSMSLLSVGRSMEALQCCST